MDDIIGITVQKTASSLNCNKRPHSPLTSLTNGTNHTGICSDIIPTSANSDTNLSVRATHASDKKCITCLSNKNSHHKCSKSDWIKLNVGGTCFLTTRTTLSKDPESILSKLANEDLGNFVADGKVCTT